MSTLLDRGRNGQSLADLGIIDMHGHLGSYAYMIPDLSPAGLVQIMDRLGVAQVVCSSMACMTRHVERGNREVLEAMRAFPDRILGYVVLWPSSPEDVRREAERGLQAGFAGIKIHNANGISYTHPAYEPAFRMANDRRLPVLLHTWGEAPVLEEIHGISQRYPEASFLLAHSGAANEPAYVRLARERANVFLDLAFSQAPRGLAKRLVDAVGADKVVWGSDIYFFSQTQQIGKVLGAHIPDEDKIKILSGNAKKILGMIRRV